MWVGSSRGDASAQERRDSSAVVLFWCQRLRWHDVDGSVKRMRHEASGRPWLFVSRVRFDVTGAVLSERRNSTHSSLCGKCRGRFHLHSKWMLQTSDPRDFRQEKKQTPNLCNFMFIDHNWQFSVLIRLLPFNLAMCSLGSTDLGEERDPEESLFLKRNVAILF